MTSVQNHLRPSSGNNLILFVFLSVLGFSFFSCASSKTTTRVVRPTNSRPSTTTVEKNEKPKVDTVSWTILDETTAKPIESSDESFLNPLLRTFEIISLLIPFENSGDSKKLSRGEKKFAHFYAGVLMALDELESVDVPMTINVYDTQRERNKVHGILQNSDLKSSDVVIGPYETDLLKSVAEWGKSRGIPVISPWKSSSSIAEKNLYYCQLRPLIEQYFEAILKVATQNHSLSNLYLINEAGSSDDSKVRAFQRMYEVMNKGREVEPIQEYIVESDSISNGDFLMFDSLLQAKPNVAFIIPNYASKESRYVYSLVRKMNAEVQDRDISIYGMPTLINAKRLDLEFFRGLNLVTVDFKFINPNNYKVKSFIENYLEKFGHLPAEDSFHGYDTIMSLVNLSNSSKGLGTEGQREFPLLSMSVEYDRYYKDRLKSSPLFGSGDFMVNSEFQVIRFINSQFEASQLK